ncbi:adenylosuccinate lyase [Candidatus Woesearchaeota archaeon]|nr:adenylosuccinate lyase [Candidatus Woesearchaeota archaeon]
MMDIFDNINPIDFRYYGRDKKAFELLQPYLSEEAFVRHLAKVEAALTGTLADYRICPKETAAEVKKAAEKVTADAVYAEEDRIRHNIRALANEIRKKVSANAKPFVHFTATSHDIICTAEALRYKAVTENVVIPVLLELEKTLIEIAKREKNTLQIGRTHGQHAEPITFGFAMAGYVSRLGNRIQTIGCYGGNLRGKMSGAVGAYNASSLFFSDPAKFEKDVLAKLGLMPSTHSTQIVEPEYVTDYMHSLISCFGVLANLSDDMRHLQRSEIAEVGELFEANQVGSSTMPHKRNPINFENVKSMWKAFVPRMMTVYLDQISEHQRDLTNSASSRFSPEIVAALVVSAIRLNKTLKRLVVDKTNIKNNFDQNKKMIAAEPLYILLASLGHENAHEAVRKLTLESQKSGKELIVLAKNDGSLKKYFEKMNKKQMEILENPEKYKGIAVKKTEMVCEHWKKMLKI